VATFATQRSEILFPAILQPKPIGLVRDRRQDELRLQGEAQRLGFACGRAFAQSLTIA
jgi:hypothetical protein